MVVVLRSMVLDHALGIRDPESPRPTVISYLQGLSVPTNVHLTVEIECISPGSRVALKSVSSGGELYWNKLEHKHWGIHTYEHEARRSVEQS